MKRADGSHQPRILRNAPALEEACARVRADGILSLDTEFVWRNTYHPRLGLVQLGSRDACWGLDCLSGTRPDALAALIADASVVKILHDARQDLSLLRRYTGALPKNVFDTQTAAAFAGFPAGIGLRKLLSDALGVGLSKTETCTDWTRRPLSEAQVEYAMDDVRHLPALRDELLSRAETRGTRAWLEEELRRADEPGLYADCDPGTAWTRIRLRRVRLDPHGFATLRAVAALREELARELDLPRGWLGDDDSLVDMAADGRVGRYRHRLNGGRADVVRAKYARAIDAARALPEEECPVNPHVRHVPEVLEATDRAMAWLRVRADVLGVDAGMIASRATVTAYLDDVDDESNPLASGWRHEVAGLEMAARFGVG